MVTYVLDHAYVLHDVLAVIAVCSVQLPRWRARVQAIARTEFNGR